MNTSFPPSYEAQEWDNRTRFMRMLSQAAAANHITLEWLCDDWIVRLQKNNATRYITGYVFPLNDAATGSSMRDKAAAYALLAAAGIPALPHYLLPLTRLRGTNGIPEQAQQLTSLPFVLKPTVGEGGFDVKKCFTAQDVRAAIAELAQRHRLLAVSPFATVTHEYRVVVLDGTPLVTFEKQREPGEWRHNLKLGATPQIVTDAPTLQTVHALAVAALTALNGRLAAIDIVFTPEGYKIAEINSGIALNYFGAHSAEYQATAVAVYNRILDAAMA